MGPTPLCIWNDNFGMAGGSRREGMVSNRYVDIDDLCFIFTNGFSMVSRLADPVFSAGAVMERMGFNRLFSVVVRDVDRKLSQGPMARAVSCVVMGVHSRGGLLGVGYMETNGI